MRNANTHLKLHYAVFDGLGWEKAPGVPSAPRKVPAKKLFLERRVEDEGQDQA